MSKHRQKPKQDYDYHSIHEEREYGFFWYDWLWRLVRPVLVFVASLTIVCGILITAWEWVDESFLAPVDTADTSLVTFTVASGSSLTRVSNDLAQAGLISNKTVFKYLTDFMGMGQKIQAGEYALSKSMTLMDIMDQLTTGDGKPITRTITVIPGWTIDDIAERFYADGVITNKEEFLSLCKTGENFKDYYYINDVIESPNSSQRKYVLEGYLSPNTYEIYTSASASDIIKKLLAQTEAAYPATFEERAQELEMSMDEVLTLASMIEREGKADEFARVSAVFHNRLDQGIALGSDVTVQYATNSEKMALTNSELSVNSLYNTYKNRGLPLGPICNPSTDAIVAALYPDEQFRAQNYLYFCSTDPNGGGLHFSKTQEEHDKAVAIYRPLWEEYDKSRGL